MVVLAWHPNNELNLSLGSQDQLGTILDELPITESVIKSGAVSERIKNALGDDAIRQLKRFVPYRLLTPFFQDSLSGLPDQQKNAKIAELSRHNFNSNPPLYRLNSDDEIELHPRWLGYMKTHHHALQAIAISRFADYLIRHNANRADFITALRVALMNPS